VFRMKSLALAASIVVAPLTGALLAPAPVGALTTAPTVSATNWTNAAAAPGGPTSGFMSISCTTSTFCVGVGTQNGNTGGGVLTERWDGSAWTTVANPSSSSVEAQLVSVSCVGITFCMGVGSDGTTGTAVTLTWNGSTWVAAPGITVPSGATASGLSSVSCVSATLCETLGTYFAQPGNVTTVDAFQWNGTTWSPIAAMTPAASGSPAVTQATGMQCVSATWCIAVGNTNTNSNGTPFSEVWNGTSWTLQTTPTLTTGVGGFLSSVSCAGPTFCQAVGENIFAVPADDQNLIETWNGSAWSIDANVPNAAPNKLAGVDCISTTACTAVGSANPTSSATSLVLNWDGRAWSTVPNTPNGGGLTTVSAVSCVTDWACVAVGTGANTAFAMSAPIARSGYRFVASDGGVFAYGASAPFLGSTGGTNLNAPVVGIGVMPAGDGYDLVASDGGVFTYGSAQFYGSTGGTHLNKPIVGMALTPDGGGYWLVASDGGVFSYGDAQFYGSAGSIQLNKPIVAMASTPDGRGYWLVASDGGIFNYGDAPFYGSTGSIALNRPIVGVGAPVGGGYYLVASDGGIFSFPSSGVAAPPFYGSTGSLTLNKPIVGMADVAGGYYLAGSDGGIFSYPGTAGVPPFLGSTGSIQLDKPIVGVAS
jgi:hypothetical protein